MLTYYLRENTTFFQDHIKEKFADLLDTNEWDILIGALILRHIGQLVSNGHAIVDYRQNIFTTDALKLMLHKNQPNGAGIHLLLKSQRIFTGIFPRISMLNHSCDPNIRNCFNGKHLTIVANRDIAEGEQVFNCYGPQWKLMSYQERQNTLRQQYNFDCTCLKCINRNDEYVSRKININLNLKFFSPFFSEFLKVNLTVFFSGLIIAFNVAFAASVSSIPISLQLKSMMTMILTLMKTKMMKPFVFAVMTVRESMKMQQ